MENADSKKIEIVSGNGKDLNISPVTDYINIERPKEKKEKKSIIIPEGNEDTENTENDEDN